MSERFLAIASFLKAHGQEIECRVDGTSMGATLPARSQVRIRCGEPDEYVRDAIVAFVAGSRIVSHRIVHRGRRGPASEYLITRGDGRVLPDPPVRLRSVLGTVTGVRVGERWVQPGSPLARPPLRRLPAMLLVLLAKAALELNVRLAERLAMGLLAARAALLGPKREPEPQGPETP